MSLLMMLAASGARESVTVTFTANGTWMAPAGVTSVDLLGKGAAGTPSSTGTRTASAQVDSVQGHSSGSGATSGALNWADFQADTTAAFNAINAGGDAQGQLYGVTYDGYPGTGTYTASLYQIVYSGAVAGTAQIVTSPGWKTSGAVLASDYGFSRIEYTQSYTIAPTTGASASAFGKTFPGGYGGAAVPTSYTGVAVTPGQSYSIVVPAGGSITITYLK